MAIKILILGLVTGGVFVFAFSAFAAVEVADSPCGTRIIFSSPAPNLTYAPGDSVNFSGSFRVNSCGDGLFYNKITFFVAPDIDVPLKTVDAGNPLNYCLGASSDYCQTVDCDPRPNSQWRAMFCDFPDCQTACGSIDRYDQIKVLDENDPDYKVYRLGTVVINPIYPADVLQGARPYWVEYTNETFTIPSIEELGFSGNVRFYVQYSGTHWGSHWHWNITYQPGMIVEPGPIADSCYNWAWSENFGWVSFDKETGCKEPYTCPSSDYGVVIDSTSYDLSGHAWSEHLGWISFNRSETDDPPEDLFPGGPIARYDPSTREITGWMRVLSVKDQPDYISGGWDGWTKFNNTKVALNGDWSGWAWSSELLSGIGLGWLSFNNTDPGAGGSVCYKVKLNIAEIEGPPVVKYLSHSRGNYCSANPYHSLSWTYYSDNSDENEYELQIDIESGFSAPFTMEISRTGLSNENGTINREDIQVTEIMGDSLDFNTTYYWQVRVKDSEGIWSEWITGPSFTTDAHKYPDINSITSDPEEFIAEDEDVQFTADAECFDINNNTTACADWAWEFENGTPDASNGQIPPLVQFGIGENLQVSLELTDADGYNCSEIKIINVEDEPPIWIEE